MKKLISTIMCLALLVGCLAGCGGNTQTGAADGKGLKMLLSLSCLLYTSSAAAGPEGGYPHPGALR